MLRGSVGWLPGGGGGGVQAVMGPGRPPLPVLGSKWRLRGTGLFAGRLAGYGYTSLHRSIPGIDPAPLWRCGWEDLRIYTGCKIDPPATGRSRILVRG